MKAVRSDISNFILFGYDADTKFPLFSSYVKAGFPSPAEDYAEERISLLKFLSGNPIATFYVLLEGDSMIDFNLFEGDLLVIDRSLEYAPAILSWLIWTMNLPSKCWK